MIDGDSNKRRLSAKNTTAFRADRGKLVKGIVNNAGARSTKQAPAKRGSGAAANQKPMPIVGGSMNARCFQVTLCGESLRKA
jgi:hypothetical protein